MRENLYVRRFMSGGRNYSAGTPIALATLCNGTCYWPGCPEPVVVFVNEKPVNNLQIAHIHALESKGARYENDMSDEELNSFDNLILLCKPHHTTVDVIEKDKYPAKLLRDWKSKREKDGATALRGLRGLTEEKLQELITKAIEVRDKNIEDALTRFAETDSEAAALLKGLIEELNDLHRRPILDEGIVNQLSVAAERLKLDEGLINQLHDAATKMWRIRGNM
jgi:hypothetical protein